MAPKNGVHLTIIGGQAMTKEAIQVAIQANVPILIWGPPGMGKTSYIQQLADEYDAHLETVIASLRDPTDFGGLPIKDESKRSGVSLAPPAWAIRAAEAFEAGEDSWVFLDEITTAAPASQSALLRVIHERVVGDLPLPFGVRMVAAANPPEQAAGGWDLAPPVANRFCHYQWTTSATEWADGMVQGFPPARKIRVTDSYTELVPKHRSIIASFVKNSSQYLLAIPKGSGGGIDDAKAGGAWPSPRSWDMAATLLAACENAGGGAELRNTLVQGCIGDGTAGVFLTWLKEQDLPDPELLLRDPSQYTVPDRADKIYTVVTAVVGAMIGKPTADRYMNAWKILAATAAAGHTDVGAAAARTLAQHAKNSYGDASEYVKPFVPMLQEAGLVKKREKK